MPSLKAWMKRPSGLIKRGRKCKRFKSEYFDYGKEWFVRKNILNQWKLLPGANVMKLLRP